MTLFQGDLGTTGLQLGSGGRIENDRHQRAVIRQAAWQSGAKGRKPRSHSLAKWSYQARTTVRVLTISRCFLAKHHKATEQQEDLRHFMAFQCISRPWTQWSVPLWSTLVFQTTTTQAPPGVWELLTPRYWLVMYKSVFTKSFSKFWVVKHTDRICEQFVSQKSLAQDQAERWIQQPIGRLSASSFRGQKGVMLGFFFQNSVTCFFIVFSFPRFFKSSHCVVSMLWSYLV